MEEEKKSENLVTEEDDFVFDDDHSDEVEPDVGDDTSPAENGDNTAQNSTPQKQSSKQNHEQKLKRLEEEKKKAYTKGQIDALKINPYTKREIKSETDLELYKLMKEAEEAGKDAVQGGYESYFEKQNREREELLAKETNAKKIEEQQRSQLASFKKAVPDEDTRTRLLADENFKEMYQDVIANGGDLGKAAKAFLKMEEAMSARVFIKNKAKTSQPPNPNDGEDGAPNDINTMSDEEVHKEFEKKFKKSF